MNHPYPDNIPILRNIYQGRFSHVRFFIPFERLNEPDVLTVYRGSYVHAAYLTDYRETLAKLDCDYYLVLHDDVLLNPHLTDETFEELFPIGIDDGFIPAFSTPSEPGASLRQWAWLFSFIPKLLYPKSLLFGGGVEIDVLKRYLPSRAVLRQKFARYDLKPLNFIRLTLRGRDDVTHQPSRVFFHGLSGWLGQDAAQARSNQACAAAERAFVEALSIVADVDRARSGAAPFKRRRIPLPIPISTAANMTDLYIVPKSRFAEFCHYVGVTAAANLFVELVISTMLIACCEKLWTAADLGLIASGMKRPAHLDELGNRRFLAIHPFKLSTVKQLGEAERLLAKLEAIRRGTVYEGEPAAIGRWPSIAYVGEGWHGFEGWGNWSMARGKLVFNLRHESKLGPLVLCFVGPISTTYPKLGARVLVNEVPAGMVISSHEDPETSIIIQPNLFVPGRNVIDIICERTVRACDCDASSDDERPLGLGLRSVEWLPPAEA